MGRAPGDRGLFCVWQRSWQLAPMSADAET